MPVPLGASTSTPMPSSCLTKLTWPFCAAICKGLLPLAVSVEFSEPGFSATNAAISSLGLSHRHMEWNFFWTSTSTGVVSAALVSPVALVPDISSWDGGGGFVAFQSSVNFSLVIFPASSLDESNTAWSNLSPANVLHVASSMVSGNVGNVTAEPIPGRKKWSVGSWVGSLAKLLKTVVKTRDCQAPAEVN